MGLDEFDFGQTPVDPEQISGLRIPMVSSLAQINSLEQANINEALRWLLTKRSISNLLTESFIRRLHKRMFGQVWKWAGEYRKTDTNYWPKMVFNTDRITFAINGCSVLDSELHLFSH